MNSKQEKKRRRFTREKYREAINGVATSALRKEMWRLARSRDILGVLAIVEGIVIGLLLILLLGGGVK